MTKKTKTVFRTWKDGQVADEFVHREVYYNLSYLVSELIKSGDHEDLYSVTWKEAEGEEPLEALEHWLVSEWLADKLEEKGEMILRDFLGLTIWGRTTSGQGIGMDGIICEIYDSYIADK